MIKHRMTLSGLACAALLLMPLAGCADRAPTALVGASILDQKGGRGMGGGALQQRVSVLRRTLPIPADIVASKVIGRRGGRIEITEAGLRIDFRKGALGAPTLITVTALAGDGVAYEFGPHGTAFGGEVVVTQRLGETTAKGNPVVLNQLEAGYFNSAEYQADQSGSAVVHEILPVQLDVSGSHARFQVQHFSGYLLASARTK